MGVDWALNLRIDARESRMSVATEVIEDDEMAREK
jgi:hypothetical protein